MEAGGDARRPAEFLKRLEGRWTCTTTILMGPGPAMTSTGTATNELTLGGRFLLQKSEGSMMGMPVVGQGLLGYNTLRRQYVASWADTAGAGIIHSHGSLDQKGDTLTMFGLMDEPMTGEIGKTVRFTTRVEGPDRLVMEVAEVQYGEPFTVVTVTFDRAGTEDGPSRLDPLRHRPYLAVLWPSSSTPRPA